MSLHHSTPAQFVRDATTFSDFITSTDWYGLDELRHLVALLASLCASAYRLPDTNVEEVDESVTLSHVHATERTAIATKVASGLPQDFYWCIDGFLFHQEVEPTVAQLSDDLADIWSELESGLRTWRRGDEDAKCLAASHWRLTFHAHWGFHAVNALAFLHQLVQHHREDEEPESR